MKEDQTHCWDCGENLILESLPTPERLATTKCPNGHNRGSWAAFNKDTTFCVPVEIDPKIFRRRIEDRLRKDSSFLRLVQTVASAEQEGFEIAFLPPDSPHKKHVGATTPIKISNMERYINEYRDDLMNAEAVIRRLASMLYREGIQFDESHPAAERFSLASRAPKDMAQDMLEG